MGMLIKFRRVMFLIGILLLFACFSYNIQAENIDNNAQSQDICLRLSDKAVLRNTNPGYYYFMAAYCKLPDIHDRQSMNNVIKLLLKSISYNYPFSHFMLATLYQDKFTSGTALYGVKGEPSDLLQSIDQYKKAAEYCPSIAENALGAIYLDYANLSEQNQREFSSSHDVDESELSIRLPDIDNAVYWLTKAAKDGDPAAQGTLSDLYRQGIGVPQDFVLAYVWQNLSVASQFRFNPTRTQDYLGKKMTADQLKVRDELYSKLTSEQKDEAQLLLTSYSRDYFKAPNLFDQVCRNIQMAMSAQNISRLINVVNNKKIRVRS